MNHLSLIESVGFRCVGRWHVTCKGLDFAIDKEVKGARKSLYAFVHDAEVLYIGKAMGRFTGRLSGYKTPNQGQRTNFRVHPLLAEIAGRPMDIAIYHFQPSEEVRYRGILLNLAAGLEDMLIETISPRWNMNGRTKAK